MNIDPEARVEEISVGEQQRVEILKVLYRQADILIFDEPTAVLTPQEVSELFKIMRESQGRWQNYYLHYPQVEGDHGHFRSNYSASRRKNRGHRGCGPNDPGGIGQDDGGPRGGSPG